jgi:hypothetical protein
LNSQMSRFQVAPRRWRVDTRNGGRIYRWADCWRVAVYVWKQPIGPTVSSDGKTALAFFFERDWNHHTPIAPGGCHGSRTRVSLLRRSGVGVGTGDHRSAPILLREPTKRADRDTGRSAAEKSDRAVVRSLWRASSRSTPESSRKSLRTRCAYSVSNEGAY